MKTSWDYVGGTRFVTGKRGGLGERRVEVG